MSFKQNQQVNSYHHQGVRTLAKRFQPMAIAEDGLIEGFYDPFIVGLQFHPERMISTYEGNKLVYTNFLEACRVKAGEMVEQEQNQEHKVTNQISFVAVVGWLVCLIQVPPTILRIVKNKKMKLNR